AAVAAGVAAGSRGVTDYGKAEVGDKTLVDALVPFSGALTHAVDAGAGLTDAWRTAADAATRAAQATADLLPRMGRARTHGQNSVGTPDPGAISLALIVTAVGETLAEQNSEKENAHA
ncbi:DAK2 domain-containing protein, partial [Microbacterium sp. CPCC 204701]|uniref:DAK2 domain-containing protein n=1 Tax=Microbacterium sp. CPCC 204701 TaxID=2493084 RepID=UPI000FD72DC6